MNEKQSLKENVRHGTSGQPVSVIHFTTGAGTFYPDHFLWSGTGIILWRS